MASDVAPDEAGLSGVRRTVAIACVLAGLVLVVLDAAIANVALPSIAHALGVSPASAVRVVTAYQLALVMALLPLGALGESVGYRRVYTAGTAVFTGASVLCALSPSLEWLLVARFLQGLGGAAIMSLAVALLRSVVRSRELGAAVGWIAIAVALGGAAGPTVGALVLEGAGWPWLFAINLPVGVLVLVATQALPDVRREMPRSAPLLPFDLLRDRSFRVSVVASIACFIGQGAAFVALPFYLHHGLGLGTLRTGLLMTPWPLAVAVVALVAGRLADRVSGSVLCLVGGAMLSLGLASMALWPMHGRPLAAVPFLVLCGAGFGLFQVSNNRNMFLSAPRERSGAAGGMQGTARLTGQTLGASTMAVLFAACPLDLAPRLGLSLAAALTLTAGLISTRRT